MTREEKLEYFFMSLMCASVAFGLYWVAIEIRQWGKPTAETRYIDTGFSCTDKY